MSFAPATRKKAKLKIALIGPSGSGKTYSALLLAKGLGGRVAVVDTERGSASLYAGKEEMPAFDVVEPQSFEPEQYIHWLKEALKQSYDVVIFDSLTHEWTATKDFINKVAEGSGNSWAAWSKGTPRHQALIDAILQSPIHVIVTMRSKTEWVTEKDERGKVKPVKVGLAPDQRPGIEYEFTTMFDINHSNVATATKDRTQLFSTFVDKLTPEVGERMMKWLESGEENLSVVRLSDAKKNKIFALLGDLSLDYENPAVRARIQDITGKDSVSLMTEIDGDKLISALEAKIKEIGKNKAKEKKAKAQAEKENLKKTVAEDTESNDEGPY